MSIKERESVFFALADGCPLKLKAIKRMAAEDYFMFAEARKKTIEINNYGKRDG